MNKKKDHEDDLHHIHPHLVEEQWEEEHPAWKIAKRVFFGAAAILIFYLMFTYMGIGPDNLQIFEGQLASTPLDEDWILYINNETRVEFTEELYVTLLDLYANNQEHEFKACLYGEIREEPGLKVYAIDELYVPEIFDQSVYHVASAGCDTETLISLHSHPYKHCLFSDQDIKTYEKFKITNPQAIIAIMCEEARFTFYGH